MRTVLIILAMWLLLNVLFVVVMSPPRRPRKYDAPRASDSNFAPATIDKEAHRYDAEEKTSLSFIIISVAMGAFFVLAAPIAEAVDAIKGAFKKKPPTEQAANGHSPSRLLQKLRAQHQAFDLVGAAFDLVFIVGEVDVLDHGAPLQHGGRALQLQVFDQRDGVALGEQRAV